MKRMKKMFKTPAEFLVKKNELTVIPCLRREATKAEASFWARQ